VITYTSVGRDRAWFDTIDARGEWFREQLETLGDILRWERTPSGYYKIRFLHGKANTKPFSLRIEGTTIRMGGKCYKRDYFLLGYTATKYGEYECKCYTLDNVLKELQRLATLV